MNTDRVDRTPRGVGKRNGFSPATIYKEIGSGRLKAKKVGTRTFIPPEYEQAWIDAMPDVVVENGHIVTPSHKKS